MTTREIKSVEEAGIIAVGLSENLDAKDQAMFVAGFQECVKYLAGAEPLSWDAMVEAGAKGGREMIQVGSSTSAWHRWKAIIRGAKK